MERAVHGTAWHPRQHNYHPSFPTRRMRMVDDLTAYRATSVAWGALGGGGISLPHLEEEAFGRVDARGRIYGTVNDAEYVAEAKRRGITVFGVVFCAQAWEFPIELNQDESEILALNELRGVGHRDWLGLREFGQDRYPALWKPFSHYFPEGLVNRAGALVTDLIDECCVRDIHLRKRHARWLESPDREHKCYLMHLNNASWREYLKAIVRLQIDAGVDGVQFDEPDAAWMGIGYGGCFCGECMEGFRRYLAALDGIRRPPDLHGVELATFDYRAWLLDQDADPHRDFEGLPLFWDYLRYQRQALTANLTELAEAARSSARTQGREIRVGANLLHFADRFHAAQPAIDLPLTEQRETYRQPAWYRYVSGFVDGGPVVAVMNPYGGDVIDLVADLHRGRSIDVYRLALFEAAAHGVSLGVPYGAWMGSVVEDAFYGPHAESVAAMTFLADHDDLFGPSAADVAFVYSIESAMQTTEHDVPGAARAELYGGFGLSADAEIRLPFWSMAEAFAAAHQPMDVIVLPDPVLRRDTLTADALSRYRTVVLPDARSLEAADALALLAFLNTGGLAVITDPFAADLDPAIRTQILGHARIRVVPRWDGFDLAWLADGPQVVVTNTRTTTAGPAILDAAVHVHRVARGFAVHIVRFDFDAAGSNVPLPRLRVSIRLDECDREPTVADPDARLTAQVTREGPWHHLDLHGLGVYGIVVLNDGATR